jgi:hypothetical protein
MVAEARPGNRLTIWSLPAKEPHRLYNAESAAVWILVTMLRRGEFGSRL